MSESPNNRIRERVEEELEQLTKEVDGVRPLFEKLANREPDGIEMRAAALTLHGFYNGVEAIFLIIAKYVDGQVPNDVRWHRQLLDQMKRPTDRRAAVIDQRDYDTLLEYLSFRHMVRHNYPGTLNWNRFRKIARGLEDSHNRIDYRIRQFLTETLDQRRDETER